MGCFYYFFMHEINSNLIYFRRMNIFVIFLWICSRESTKVLFSPSATNIEGEVLSYLVQVRCFQLSLRQLLVRTGGEKKSIRKQLTFFIQQSSNQLMLLINVEKNLKELLVHFPKEKRQQHQKKKTKTKKKIKPKRNKPKLKAKQ